MTGWGVCSDRLSRQRVHRTASNVVKNCMQDVSAGVFTPSRRKTLYGGNEQIMVGTSKNLSWSLNAGANVPEVHPRSTARLRTEGAANL